MEGCCPGTGLAEATDKCIQRCQTIIATDCDVCLERLQKESNHDAPYIKIIPIFYLAATTSSLFEELLGIM